ncbi:MAG: GGDEF domain-containing protein [Armatimonadota bacterium]|nr:MAG: GGDEF domain-containing protein [Armatimonadota bacterium]
MPPEQPLGTHASTEPPLDASGDASASFTAMTAQIASVVRLVVLLTVVLMLRLRQLPLVFDSLDILLALGACYVVVTTLFPRRWRSSQLTRLLLICDIVLISGLIWITGGTRSEYYLLYYLPILHGASRLNFRDAITASVLAAICYLFIAIAAGPLVPIMTTGILRAGAFGGSVIILAVFFAVLSHEARTNRLLTEKLREAFDSVSAVYDIARVASTRDSVQDVMGTTLRQAMRLSEADGGVLAVLDSEGRFHVAAQHGADDAPEVAFDQALAGTAIEGRRWLSREVADPRPDKQPAHEFFIPMFAGWHPLAVMQIRTTRPAGLQERDMELVRALCAEAAMAIENARLRAETKRAAATDYLTGLCNRREFALRLEAEIRRTARHGGEVALVLLDADDFKRCNDSHGHQAGDQVLQALAERIEAVIRGEDTAARYGGDEFAIILPQTDIAGARVVAQKLQRELQTLTFDWSADTWQLTVSTGVSASGEELSANLLLQKADRALYEAKSAGKNQICVWQANAQAESAATP